MCGEKRSQQEAQVPLLWGQCSVNTWLVLVINIQASVSVARLGSYLNISTFVLHPLHFLNLKWLWNFSSFQGTTMLLSSDWQAKATGRCFKWDSCGASLQVTTLFQKQFKGKGTYCKFSKIAPADIWSDYGKKTLLIIVTSNFVNCQLVDVSVPLSCWFEEPSVTIAVPHIGVHGQIILQPFLWYAEQTHLFKPLILRLFSDSFSVLISLTWPLQFFNNFLESLTQKLSSIVFTSTSNRW